VIILGIILLGHRHKRASAWSRSSGTGTPRKRHGSTAARWLLGSALDAQALYADIHLQPRSLRICGITERRLWSLPASRECSTCSWSRTTQAMFSSRLKPLGGRRRSQPGAPRSGGSPCRSSSTSQWPASRRGPAQPRPALPCSWH